MSTVILLGAGASYGSIDCVPNCPPLGANLFAALQQRGGIAATVAPEMAEIFASDFERGMVAFREQRDRDTTALLREMAAYFVEFAPGPRNLYRELVAVARDARDPVGFVTTNYDVLIEDAIVDSGLLIAYDTPVPPGTISLIKIHGSCHFLPDTGGLVLIGARFSGNDVNVETPIRTARSRQEVRAFCRTQDSLAPSIAVYAPGKAVLFASHAVRQQKEYWHRMLAGSSAVYVIGLRVVDADEHIWGALATANARIDYVGFEPDRFLSWAEGERRANVHVLARTFQEALPILRARLCGTTSMDA